MTPNNTFIPDPVVSAAITDATVNPDGLPFYKCKFNDAGEFFGVTQVEEVR